MNIVHHFQCEKCNKKYTGAFKLTIDSKIVCRECNQKESYDGLNIKLFNNNTIKSTYIIETYKKILIEDVETIYNLESSGNEDFSNYFYTFDGKIDTDKLMFQNNPVSLVFLGHTLALKSLKYLQSNKDDKKDKKYEKEAKEIIKRYKELRDKKLDVEELQNLWELFKSQEAVDIVQEVIN